jgi:hypothetical protein
MTDRTARATTARLFAAAAAFALWLVLPMFGHALGGATHLLLVAGAMLVPWRSALAVPAEDR